MKRRAYILALIILSVAAEFLLIRAVPLLESHNHPLVSSLTCLETGERDDLYWTINGDQAGREGATVVAGRHRFSFENPHDPKVRWLRAHTLPVVQGVDHQWDRFRALRSWVSEQIPYGDAGIKSHWDAQRILEAAWSSPAAGFICDAFAATYVSACASVGLNARMIHLGDGRGYGHYAAEVWSDDHDKWIFMDPLYNWHFTLNGLPLTALELHDLWKRGELGKLEKWGNDPEKPDHGSVPPDYFNLLQDIQVITANNFLSSPHTSVFDLLSFRIRHLRWVDETNPRYDRIDLARKLAIYYYLPKVLRAVVIPFVLPAWIVFLVVGILRRERS